MCKVRTGTQVQSYEDIRNIITGLILRQENMFREEDILRMVKYYSDGSSVEISQRKLTELIQESLDLFCRYDLVSCRNGYYSARKVSHTLVSYCAN